MSAAIEMIFQKDKKELYYKKYQMSSWVIAPDLYIFELTNVIWKYHKTKILNHDECLQYVEDGVNLIDNYFDPKEMWKESIGESVKNNHSAYDMFYAVLARRNDAALLTNDKKLAQICKALNIETVI